MALEQQLFTALRSLVSNRVYPTIFQQPDGTLPAWPALRYTITASVPIEDLCGDGDDQTADVSVQIDVVDKTYAAVSTLRLSVMAAMRGLPTPARMSFSSREYDSETLTHRAILIYDVTGSSDPDVDSPP